jgi:hypothetical protein
MATTHFKGDPVTTVGNLPEVGQKVPDFELVGMELAELTNKDLQGKRVVFNIFPSIDTGVCATSVRRFNEQAADLSNTTVVCVSADLPFALARFCGAEGIKNVVTTSSFRSSFGEDFGVTLLDSPLQGLLARAVIVTDENGVVIYKELVDEIGQEPDYEQAIAALG